MWPYASVGWGFGPISAVTASWGLLTAPLSRCGLLILEFTAYGVRLDVLPLLFVTHSSAAGLLTAVEVQIGRAHV